MEEITPTLTNHIKVKLTGIDSNAFVILAACRKQLRASGLDNWSEIWDTIHQEANSSYLRYNFI
jgi:hypothetical protein